MKKLLIFMLVLGMASMAVAVPVFRVDPADKKDSYQPSDIITIQLYDDGQVDGFSIDAIVDVICGTGTIAGGYSEEPQWMAAFGYQQFGYLMYDGKLVVGTAASIGGTTEPPKSGVLYSFEYHVPDLPYSTMICIESYNDDIYMLPIVDYRDGTRYTGPIGMEEGIHVAPEPATIALLGLGGLLLRRRK